MRNNNNKEDDNPRSSHVYAVINENEDGTTFGSEINHENIQFRDNNNEEGDNSYALHVYAVVNKKKDNRSPMYSNITAAEKNDDEMTVQLSGSNYVNTK